METQDLEARRAIARLQAEVLSLTIEVRELRSLVTPLDPGSLPPDAPKEEGG
jgi:hypothetical protein